MTSSAKVQPLDPHKSMADLASVMAQLSLPFANAGDVLGRAGITKSALEAAKTKWGLELRRNEKLARLYGEIYHRERARMRARADAPSKAKGLEPTSHEVAVGPEETALLPMLELPAEVLPFIAGRFEPPTAEPQPPRENRPFDPDGTQLAAMIDGETLPFLKTPGAKKR